MYYTQEQIDHANQADIVSFLQSQGEQLTRAGNEYRWKRHDSLTVRGNKWYRHSQSKGGAPVDFVMEFFGKSFTEAVELLTGEKGAAPPPDRPSPAPISDFRLPPRSPDNRTARNYLTAARRIDEDVSGFFFSTGDIYEEAAHHNAVFVGRDESGVPRYAHQRGTAGSFRLDVKGSDKAFNFCYRGEDERLFVFEAPIDLLSFLCLFKKDWQKQSYLALGGVGEKALLRFLSDRPNIKTVFLCLDSDEAGNDACSRLAELVPEGLTVHRLIPLFKDWNEVLQHRAEITDGKYLREAIYGLKEPPQEETVEIIRMSEVDTQTVEWLWKPYLNKAAGGQSAYRGLGSIDFRAAARSVLLIGRVKREPNVRVIVHDKSSLAPEGKPIAFCLDPETGFSWIGEYDITADELLSGAGGNNATKTEQAERLILDLLELQLQWNVSVYCCCIAEPPGNHGWWGDFTACRR